MSFSGECIKMMEPKVPSRCSPIYSFRLSALGFWECLMLSRRYAKFWRFSLCDRSLEQCATNAYFENEDFGQLNRRLFFSLGRSYRRECNHGINWHIKVSFNSKSQAHDNFYCPIKKQYTNIHVRYLTWFASDVFKNLGFLKESACSHSSENVC